MLRPEPEEIPNAGAPPFFREIADAFLSRQSNVFLLSGNVPDLVDAGSPAKRHVFLDEYLTSRLETRDRIVVSFNIARGISFSGNDIYSRLRDFYSRFDAAGAIEETKARERRALAFDRRVAESQVYMFLTLRFLEELCKLARLYRADAPGSITIVIQHADMMLPDAPPAQLSEIDRQKLTLLREWFTGSDFAASNEQVILITPTAAAIHADLRRLSQVRSIHVPMPDVATRQGFIESMEARAGGGALDRPAREVAELTAGMTLLTIQSLFLQARHRDGKLEDAAILEALRRLLASELGDKIEIVKPAHTMADVIGASAMKTELDRLRRLLETRDPKVAPVGILVAGPNGAGKTFIFEAWAAECGRLVVMLKNLRSMYFGQTDQIFEKLRTVLEALGNVIVFIDEADTVFRKPGNDTHETEARLFGNLIQMMGNPRNRGRIVWILLTARPDQLAPDLKRSGRAGLHLPVFDPEGDDRRAYVDHVLRKGGADPGALSAGQRKRIDDATAELSPADFNEVLVELRAEKAIHGALGFDGIVSVLGNIMPGQIGAQRRVQILNAFLECSRRSLLPPSLADLSREDAERELAALG